MNNSTVFFGHDQYEESIRAPHAFKVISVSVAISFAALIAAVGNTLVIVSFLKSPDLRNSTNCFFANMAVCDLLYAVTDWTLYASGRLFGGSVLSFRCKLGMYLTHVSYSVSIESLVLITVDRFIATVFPMKVTRMTGKIRAVFILLTWVIPMVVLVPYLLFSRSAQETDVPFLCADDSGTRLLTTIFPILGVVLYYLIPLIVIIILNTGIIKSLRRTNPVIQANGLSNYTRRQKQNQRIMKVLVTINVVFFTCWTLYYLSFFLLQFLQKDLKRDTQEMLVILCLRFLPFISTAVNPVILFTVSTNYRQALRNCLRLAVVKCRSCFMREQAVREENIELSKVQ